MSSDVFSVQRAFVECMNHIHTTRLSIREKEFLDQALEKFESGERLEAGELETLERLWRRMKRLGGNDGPPPAA